MDFFRILLIILIALPVIAFAVIQYVHVLDYIRARNDADSLRRRVENRAEFERMAAGLAAANAREGAVQPGSRPAVEEAGGKGGSHKSSKSAADKKRAKKRAKSSRRRRK